MKRSLLLEFCEFSSFKETRVNVLMCVIPLLFKIQFFQQILILHITSCLVMKMPHPPFPQGG